MEYLTQTEVARQSGVSRQAVCQALRLKNLNGQIRGGHQVVVQDWKLEIYRSSHRRGHPVSRRRTGKVRNYQGCGVLSLARTLYRIREKGKSRPSSRRRVAAMAVAVASGSQGYTSREIAARIGYSPGSINDLVNEALSLLPPPQECACGRKFLARPGQGRPRIHCSPPCRARAAKTAWKERTGQYMEGSEERICKGCKALYSPRHRGQRYCGVDCGRKARKRKGTSITVA